MRLTKLLETNLRLLKHLSQTGKQACNLKSTAYLLNQKRLFSNEFSSNDSRPFALFPNREPYMLPNPFKVLFQNLRLRWEMARVDANFNLVEFYQGSQMALVTVSNKIATGDFNDMSDMVQQGFVDKIRNQYVRLNDSEKARLALKLTDVFSQNITDFNIHTNSSNGNIIVKIRMQFVLMNNADEIKKSFLSFYNLSFKDLLDKNLRTVTLADYG